MGEGKLFRRKKWGRWALGLAVAAILWITAGSFSNQVAGGQNWGLLGLGVAFLILALLFIAFEQKQASSRELAIIAALGALAAASRVPFSFLPGIQPVTFLTVLSGYVFGLRAGFMVGASAALVSNFFLGQGPWTPWQMLAWGLAGASGSFLSKVFPHIQRWAMVLFLFSWGFLYGWIMNLWHWLGFVYPHTWQTFLATYAASFSIDAMHAIGNSMFYLFFGERFTQILRRFARRLRVEPWS
ncbi:conserved hypothetical protein [Desulforamulus reducens MI-1]|uniref:ECF transporter S component n=1 Tax=Desulforamulus reducens (strain ATCC BAA-1160 / DSM 100696 / MI-1) TaxID=349161 RepID=A4J7X8_DESRM|nr:ECF transporter S component [Desulforamulus reducens]ABO51181.1 conserved hypothetical protein [Desulforamulus reducens MI-1]